MTFEEKKDDILKEEEGNEFEKLFEKITKARIDYQEKLKNIL